MISLVVINASSSVDFPNDGIQLFDFLNGSVTVCVESLKWCSHRVWLKRSISLCMLSDSAEVSLGL